MVKGRFTSFSDYDPQPFGLLPQPDAVGWREVDIFSGRIIIVTLICAMFTFSGMRQRIAAGADRTAERRGLMNLGLILAGICTASGLAGWAIAKLAGVPLGELASGSPSPGLALLLQFISGIAAYLFGLCLVATIRTYGGRGLVYLFGILVTTLIIFVIVLIAVEFTTSIDLGAPEKVANFVAVLASMGMQYFLIRRAFTDLEVAS